MKSDLVILFPGQGAQKIGMADEILQSMPLVSYYLSEASEIVNYDLLNLVKSGSKEEIDNTAFTQPLLLTLGYSMYKSLELEIKSKFEILAMAGHSLGEFTALLASESIKFQDAVDLVHSRGKYMRDMSNKGAMLAILGSDYDSINVMLNSLNLQNQASIANINSPSQIVVAGTLDAIEEIIEHYRDFKIKRVIKLPVTIASHCFLQHDAAQALSEKLEKIEFAKPKVDVFANLDASCYHDPSLIKHKLTKQMVSEVQWQKIMLNFSSKVTFLELGPSTVLQNLSKSYINNKFIRYSEI